MLQVGRFRAWTITNGKRLTRKIPLCHWIPSLPLEASNFNDYIQGCRNRLHGGNRWRSLSAEKALDRSQGKAGALHKSVTRDTSLFYFVLK